MTDGAAVAAIHRLVGLGLDKHLNPLVIPQHGVDRFHQVTDAFHRVFAFGADGALPGQPKHDFIAAQLPGDIDGAQGPPDGELPVFPAAAHIAAVGGVGIHPQPGGHELRRHAVPVQHGLQRSGLGFDLLFAQVIDVGHGVVIVKLHGAEAHLAEPSDFVLQRDIGPGGRTVDIRAVMDVPGADGKLEFRHKTQPSFLLFQG